MSNSDFIIYGLFDPRDGQLRYVGKSTSGLHRPRQHGMPAFLARDHGHKGNWIRSLAAEGKSYEIQVLEEHSAADDLDEAERFCIAYFKSLGCKLTNLTMGGEGPLGRKPTPRQSRLVAEANSIRVWSSESKARAAAAKLGRKLSRETRQKMSRSAQGVSKSPEHKAKLALVLMKARAARQVSQHA